MRYSFSKKSFVNSYLSFIISKLKTTIIITPIILLVGIAFIILNFTVYNQLLAIGIILCVISILLIGYMVVRYFITKKTIGNTFDTLTNDDEVKYELYLEGDNIKIINESLNRDVSTPIKSVIMIMVMKNQYILMFEDNTSIVVPNSEESLKYLEELKKYAPTDEKSK